MRAKTIQIVWHTKEPVFAVDFHPTHTNLLATGGADKDIKFWEVTQEADGSPAVVYKSSVGGITASVNALRFSPLGNVLASGGDGGEVMLWRPSEPGDRPAAALGAEPADTPPAWRTAGALRGHGGDITDLAWSPDGSALASASVENIAVLHDTRERKPVCRLEHHQHYVQGVTWDPLGHFLVTQSNDRTCRVYGPKPLPAAKRGGVVPPSSSAAMLKEFVSHATLAKRTLADNNNAGAPGPAPATPRAPVHAAGASCVSGAAAGVSGAAGVASGAAPGASGAGAKAPLFLDEAMGSFFRRLSWSPDGSLLAIPAGMFKADATSTPVPTTHLFARGDWSAPVAHLPSLARPTVAVRFCPLPFRPRPHADPNLDSPCAGLPYRFVMAVATTDSVLLYDTQSMDVIALLGGLHMAPITDLAWSADGRHLAVSSQDGYCSLASFGEGELGEVMDLGELPPTVAAALRHTHAHNFAARASQKKAVAATKAPKAEALINQGPPATTAQLAAGEGDIAAAAVAAVAAAAGGASPVPGPRAAAAPQPTHTNQPGTSPTPPPPIAPATGPRRIQPHPMGATPPAAARSQRPAGVGTSPATTPVPAPGPRRVQPTPLLAPTPSPQPPAAPIPVPAPAHGLSPAPAPRRIQPTAITHTQPAAGTAVTAATTSSGAGAVQSDVGVCSTAGGSTAAPRRIQPTPVVCGGSASTGTAAAAAAEPAAALGEGTGGAGAMGQGSALRQQASVGPKRATTGMSIAMLAAQAGRAQAAIAGAGAGSKRLAEDGTGEAKRQRC